MFTHTSALIVKVLVGKDVFVAHALITRVCAAAEMSEAGRDGKGRVER